MLPSVVLLPVEVLFSRIFSRPFQSLTTLPPTTVPNVVLFSVLTVGAVSSSSPSSELLLDEGGVVLPGSSEGPTLVSGVPGFLTIVYVENLFDEKDNFPVVEL